METSRLAAIALFRQFDEADLAVVTSAATDHEVAEGDEIVTEGDFGYALYAIESSNADVTSNGVRVATLGHGDLADAASPAVQARCLGAGASGTGDRDPLARPHRRAPRARQLMCDVRRPVPIPS
jgi:hypothetical protein